MVDETKDQEMKDSVVAKETDADAAASTDAVSKENTSAKEDSATTTTTTTTTDDKDSNKKEIKKETIDESANSSAAQESKEDQGNKAAAADAPQSVQTTNGQTDDVKSTVADEAKDSSAPMEGVKPTVADEAKEPSAPLEGIPVPVLPNLPNAMQTKTGPDSFPGGLDLGDVKVPDLNAPGSLEIDKNVSEGELGPVVSAAGKNGKAFFPMKLYDIVSDEKNEDIIKWLPGGKAFIIVDKKRFANEVLPHHFQQSQFTSFTRKLSRWRFTRVPRGPFIGAYYNKLFLKGHRSLCWHMRCKNENLGKMKFDRKMNDQLKDIPGAMDPNAAARGGGGGMMMPQQGHPGTMMVPGQMAMQGFQMPPMGGVPTHLTHNMPGHPAHPQNLQPGVNPGLNNQILAIEGRLRELRSAEQAAFMYDQQKMMAGHGHPTMDDIYANRARMMGMAPGMNNMVDYGNPRFMGAPGAAPGSAPPGSQLPPQAQAQPPVPQQMPGAPTGGPPPQLPPQQMQQHHEAPVGSAPPSAGAAPIKNHF